MQLEEKALLHDVLIAAGAEHLGSDTGRPDTETVKAFSRGIL